MTGKTVEVRERITDVLCARAGELQTAGQVSNARVGDDGCARQIDLGDAVRGHVALTEPDAAKVVVFPPNGHVTLGEVVRTSSAVLLEADRGSRVGLELGFDQRADRVDAVDVARGPPADTSGRIVVVNKEDVVVITVVGIKNGAVDLPRNGKFNRAFAGCDRCRHRDVGGKRLIRSSRDRRNGDRGSASGDAVAKFH